MIAFHPVAPTAGIMLAPGFAQSVLVLSALRGDAPNVAFIALAGGACFVLTAAALAAASRLLGSERIVFGR